ncbi:MAG TPA: 30S ribosomal protein S17 [Phycisphaerales bacterium]|nr:30S ribosomal protein S17 [Phycisphaerales bacterium]HMP36432.1 30S ribosomal protein S17 [Phycisphaerales bacterium]
MSHLKTIVVPEQAPHRVGVVDSDSRDKTRRVVIAYASKHPKYGKYVRRRTVLHVHDEKNESRVGDRVEIAECRPISKSKSWILVRVVERGEAPVDHGVDAPGA